MSLSSADTTLEVFRFPRSYAARETRPDRNSQHPWKIMDQLPSSSKFAGACWLPSKGEWCQYFPVDQKVIKDKQRLKAKDFTDSADLSPDEVSCGLTIHILY